MKRLSLQWRITLMTAALIGVTCVLMNCLIGYSGKRYMDAIGSGISAYSEIESGAPDAFDPQSKQPDDELTIIVSGAQAAFGVTNWYITAAVTLAQRPEHRHTVLAGEVQIQHDQIKALDGEHLRGALSVVAAVHAVGKPPQTARDRVAERPFIFHNQNMHTILLVRIYECPTLFII